MSEPFQVLLYYLYTRIDDPAEFRDAHAALCESLGLRGRILVAGEGINGTVSGAVGACAAYMDAMRADPVTSAMVFKIDPADGHLFPKLAVKVREEIVALGLGEDDFSPQQTTGTHLSPRDFRAMMDDPAAVLLDARNDYEWKLGRFAGALLPDVENFRDLPTWVREHRAELEGKKILTYCTGGIRCEKFSGFLRREGFDQVFQLEGGIVEYGKDPQVQGERFEGKCYVFDGRVAVPINRAEPHCVVSHCIGCGTTSERYVNCRLSTCNARVFYCQACEEQGPPCCNDNCRGALLAQGEDAAPAGGSDFPRTY